MYFWRKDTRESQCVKWEESDGVCGAADDVSRTSRGEWRPDMHISLEKTPWQWSAETSKRYGLTETGKEFAWQPHEADTYNGSAKEQNRW